MAEKLDVIIFGASGFTGKYTVFEATTVLQNLRWGVAGRNRQKLETVLKEMGTKADQDLKDIPIVIADVKDDSSLLEMARQCRVLVNCCGPYRFYGEPVVRACIEAGTHHVDVSGESQFIEKMQLKYHNEALERGVYIISACGFDSIPADMGAVFIEKHFDGVVNSVESFLRTHRGKNEAGGAKIHYGTWESAIYELGHKRQLLDIRSKLFKNKLPEFKPVLKSRLPFSRPGFIKGICLPFESPDLSVIQRSQRFMFEQESKRPIQIKTYISFSSRIAALAVAFFAVFIGLMTKFSFGRKLLLEHPKLFSFGFISHEGPSEETMKEARFSFIMYALGWEKSQRLREPTDQYIDPPNKSLTVKVSGVNPGYGATCVALLSTAVTILKESDKMPGKGGVLAPGAAFAKTDLINELQKHEHGLKFEILESKNL